MEHKHNSFEQNLARLEQIVRMMERGDVALDESLTLFREATELLQTCGKLLDDAQMQIKMILPDADGQPIETTFSEE